MTSASPRTGTDPEGAITAFIDDLVALLDKMRSAPRITLADLPDIRAALVAAIYDGPLDERCEGCEKASGAMCRAHHERARLCARWTELLHRLDGEA